MTVVAIVSLLVKIVVIVNTSVTYIVSAVTVLNVVSREYNREFDRESVSSMCCLCVRATDYLGVSRKVKSVGIRHPCNRI